VTCRPSNHQASDAGDSSAILRRSTAPLPIAFVIAILMSLLGRTLLSGGFLVGFEYNGWCEIVGCVQCACNRSALRFSASPFCFRWSAASF